MLSHSYINQSVNIQLLIDCILDKPHTRDRGTGKSFARLMLLLSRIDCTPHNTTHVYVGINQSIANMIACSFEDILNFKNILNHRNFKSLDIHVFRTNQHFSFISYSDVYRSYRGRTITSMIFDDDAYGRLHPDVQSDLCMKQIPLLYK